MRIPRPRRDIITHTDKLTMSVDILKQNIPVFPTKSAAVECGKAHGWRCAIKLIGRFETVWVVGKQDFADDFIAGVRNEVFRFPLMRLEKILGVARMQVLTVRRSAPADAAGAAKEGTE